MSVLMPVLCGAAAPALSCAQGVGSASDHEGFNDVTSLLHSSMSTSDEMEALSAREVDLPLGKGPMVRELESQLGTTFDLPADVVEALRVGSSPASWSPSSSSDELRQQTPHDSVEDACTDVQKDSGCCNPLESKTNIHWVTNATGGGEWSFSNNYIRYDFMDSIVCNGTGHQSQSGTAYVWINEPNDTVVDIWIEGVSEKLYEYVHIWLYNPQTGKRFVTWAQASESFEGGECEAASCEMCKVHKPKVTITIPAGWHAITVIVESIDFMYHVGAYFQVYFGLPTAACRSCVCRGDCANNDGAAEAAGGLINEAELTCTRGLHEGACGNRPGRLAWFTQHEAFNRSFRAACPITCSQCMPDDCHQYDEVACAEAERLNLNVSVLNCRDVARYKDTHDLCDYAMLRVACPQVCNWRGCRPTPAPTPMPTESQLNDVPPSLPEAQIPGVGDLPIGGDGPLQDQIQQATAQGDPHITNLLGKSFELRQPGKYTLVQVPKEGLSSLKVEGKVQSVGNACSLFVTECNLTGLLLHGDSVRVRASRENLYQNQHEEPTPFSLQTKPGEPWFTLASFPAGEEVLVKNYSTHGVKVEIKAKNEAPAGTNSSDGGIDAATQGFFLINIIIPRQPVHTQIRLSKRRAWFNVQVARLGKMGYAKVGGILGTSEPDAKWSEPTHACKRHLAGADAHPPASVLRVEGQHDGKLSLAEAGF